MQMSVTQLYLTHIPLIISALGALIAAYAGLRQTRINTTKIQELHIIVNDRLTQLLAATTKASLAEGQAQGIKAEQNRVKQ